MTRRDHVRRVLILCCHFLRNLAFYRVGWRRKAIKRRHQFWVTANSNFLDHCVLEWCKLFGDRRGKHHWGKVVSKPDEFQQKLLHRMRFTSAQFDAYIEEMRTYRDKFVAHLDAEPEMLIPRLRPARQSVALLYEYILTNENEGDYFPERPLPAWRFYLMYMNSGRYVYANSSDS